MKKWLNEVAKTLEKELQDIHLQIGSVIVPKAEEIRTEIQSLIEKEDPELDPGKEIEQ